jgi:endonuclease-3
LKRLKFQRSADTEKVAATTRAEAVVDALGVLYHDNLDPDEFVLFPDDGGATIETESELSDGGGTFGGRPAFECLVRTILSQNTSDAASQPAHENLLDRYDDGGDLAESLAVADRAALAETIRSAGLSNRKAEQIIGAAEWALEAYGSAEAFDDFVTGEDPEAVREALLSVDGVGPKTADCVLLFSGERGGIFPVDTHVHRIARRMGLADPDADPEACPLAELCAQVGVDTAEGTVADPADSV